MNVTLYKNLLGLFALYFVTYATSFAADFSLELKRLNKCAGMFIKQRLLITDPLWVKVNIGAMSGTDACMALYDAAQFDGNGKIQKNNDGTYSERGIRVLSSFLEFQRSQFVINEFSSANSLQIGYTPDLIDLNEPAYHYLYSFFKPNEKFSEVVTRNHSIDAQRFTNKSTIRRVPVMGTSNSYNRLADITQGDSSKTDTNFIANTDKFFQANSNYNKAEHLFVFSPETPPLMSIRWPIHSVDTGLLIGLSSEPRINKLDYPPRSNPDAVGVNVNQHFGAGVIGTQAYLLGNTDKTGPVDGGLNSQRLWSKSVISDLLCRSLPSLRSSDALSLKLVEMSSALPYRQGVSCMQCHGSMDPMAATLRNLKTGVSSNLDVNTAYSRVTFFYQLPQSQLNQPAAPYPVMGPDPQFSRRPPQGELRFRSYDGSLIDQPVQDLNDLGQKIAETNDLYVCEASKLYQWLTGILVDLSDLQDPLNAPELTTSQQKIRSSVIEMGLQLKSHQSLRTIVKQIIASPAFADADHGV